MAAAIYVASVYFFLPICSMYGLFSYIFHRFKPNVGKYTVHGAYGLSMSIGAWHVFTEGLENGVTVTMTTEQNFKMKLQMIGWILEASF